ncbi:MAG: glycosyltransferase family 4 protein [Acidobacteriota bacterium]|nr:glycosyltransferase family 4 protein [Acidobacteriota bacterium]
MKLLYVCADPGIALDGFKGASVHVRQTIGALADAGLEISVVAARPGQWHDPRCESLAVEPRQKTALHPTAMETEQAALARVPQMVRAAVEGAEAGGYDAVYERYSLWSTVGLAVAERMDIPLVLEINAPLVDEARRYRGLRLGSLAAAIEETNIAGAERVFCVSSTLCRHAARLSSRPEKIELFPNVVDLDAFSPATEDPAGDAPLIVFLGSLKPWHGVLDLLEAFHRLSRRLAGPRLRFIGDGPLRSRLEEEIAARDLGARVEVTGGVAHDEIPALLAEAQIGVAPYPKLDNFYFSPIKLVEYAAAGLAIVATETGDYRRHLHADEHLLEVPPGATAQLAAALEHLATNPALRRRLARNAREAAERHLSLDSARERLVAALHTLIARRGPLREELAG